MNILIFSFIFTISATIMSAGVVVKIIPKRQPANDEAFDNCYRSVSDPTALTEHHHESFMIIVRNYEAIVNKAS